MASSDFRLKDSSNYPPISRPEQIILIGAGRDGHNMIGLLESAGVRIEHVLDDDATGQILGREIQSIQGYVGPVWDALIAIGSPDVRRALVERLSPEGFRWAIYVDPNAVVSAYATLDEGCFVAPFSALADVQVAAHVKIVSHSVIGARVRIGAFTTIGPHVTIASDTIIGSNCMIGMGARIAAGLQIGDGCAIAPNAVVRHDMPSGHIAVAEFRTRIVKRHSRKSQ